MINLEELWATHISNNVRRHSGLGAKNSDKRLKNFKMCPVFAHVTEDWNFVRENGRKLAGCADGFQEWDVNFSDNILRFKSDEMIYSLN